HPRQAKLVAQRLHAGSDHPQVLGDQRDGAEAPPERLEEVTPRPGDPPARRRGLRPGRYLPVRLEPAEVIDPNHVHSAQQEAEPGTPPRVVVCRVGLPPIEWVPPQLTGL